MSVRINGKSLGILEQDISGKMKFRYLPDTKQPLSLSMSLREELFGDVICKAYFGGLLPENEQVRKIIAKKYGISSNNDFSLLKAIGYDCAGAVSTNLSAIYELRKTQRNTVKRR